MRDQKRWIEKLDQGIGCGNDDHCSGSHFCYGSKKKAGSMEDGAAHYVDSNGSYVKNQWKNFPGSFLLSG